MHVFKHSWHKCQAGFCHLVVLLMSTCKFCIMDAMDLYRSGLKYHNMEKLLIAKLCSFLCSAHCAVLGLFAPYSRLCALFPIPYRIPKLQHLGPIASTFNPVLICSFCCSYIIKKLWTCISFMVNKLFVGLIRQRDKFGIALVFLIHWVERHLPWAPFIARLNGPPPVNFLRNLCQQHARVTIWGILYLEPWPLDTVYCICGTMALDYWILHTWNHGPWILDTAYLEPWSLHTVYCWPGTMTLAYCRLAVNNMKAWLAASYWLHPVSFPPVSQSVGALHCWRWESSVCLLIT